MKAQFEHGGVGAYSRMLVSHGKETLEFSAAAYQHVFKSGVYEPFDQINSLWARQDPKWQDEVFELYKEAKEIFNEVFAVGQLILALRPIVTQIGKMHDDPYVDKWIRYHSGVWIPEDLDVEYVYSPDRPGSREQTYLVSDYWELVSMTLKLRPLTPLLGEFIEITKKESGTNFRDINAYYTLSRLPILECNAMHRLIQYVDKNIKSDEIDIRSSIDGIGSEMFRDNLIARILVRWLAIASLTKEPNGTHLIQTVHKTLRNRQSQSESHQNAVLKKILPSDGTEGEDSSSSAEIYKNKPQIPAGEFVAIEKWTENTRTIAARLLLRKGLNKEQGESLREALDCAQRMEAETIEEAQLHLIRWVVNPVVSARAIWDINRESVIRLAGISQFVLWNTGFKDLAAIVTARSMSTEGIGSYGGESRAHIPRDMVDRINVLYPYFKRPANKKVTKHTSEVIDEIMALSQDLTDHTWFLNLTDEQIHELRGSSVNKTFRVGYDIRVRLAQYVIYMQERNKEFLSLYDFKTAN